MNKDGRMMKTIPQLTVLRPIFFYPFRWLQAIFKSTLATFARNNFMGFLVKVLITAVAAYVAAYVLPGVVIKDIPTTVIVALVLACLNAIVKPILVILTLPITVLTLGLFLLIINALMVKWASALVDGFTVDGWLSALLFSLLVSFVSYVINKIIGDKE